MNVDVWQEWLWLKLKDSRYRIPINPKAPNLLVRLDGNPPVRNSVHQPWLAGQILFAKGSPKPQTVNTLNTLDFLNA